MIVVLLRGRRRRLVASARREHARDKLGRDLTAETTAAAAVAVAATPHGALEQGTNQTTRTTTATAVVSVRLLASAGEVADESVSDEGTQTPILIRTSNTPRTVLPRSNRLYSSIRVLGALAAIWVRDDLGFPVAVAAGHAVGVFMSGSGGGANGSWICRSLPLRDTGGELDVVVLLGGVVPLRDPAGWERRGRKGWAVVAWRRRACHRADFCCICMGCFDLGGWLSVDVY